MTPVNDIPSDLTILHYRSVPSMTSGPLRFAMGAHNQARGGATCHNDTEHLRPACACHHPP